MKVYKNLDEVADLLQSGAVGVVPTDTLYGLVAKADDQAAVARIHELKERTGKPGTIIAANIDQLVGIGMKARYLKAVEHFWPNPISVLIPCVELGWLHHGLGSVPARIPSNKNVHDFLKKTGPLQTSSANLTGQPCAQTIEEAKEYFEDRVDFYVDGGDLNSREPSTVIRVVDDTVEVVREGAVKINEAGRIII